MQVKFSLHANKILFQAIDGHPHYVSPIPSKIKTERLHILDYQSLIMPGTKFCVDVINDYL